MDISGFKREVLDAFNCKDHHALAIVEIVKRYKDVGCSQKDIYLCLLSIYSGIDEERGDSARELLVLDDVMDVVSGCIHPDCRIWPDILEQDW